MKIVITGGAGFIGSQLGYHYHKMSHDIHLVDDFSYGQKDNLVIGGKSFGILHNADIRDQKKMEEIFTDASLIVHLAGIAPLPDCQSDPQRAYSVNVGGTASVLEACRANNVPRVLFASTSAVYENTVKREGGYKEIDRISPDTVYAMTKQSAENLCLAYNNNYRMSIGILRFFNVYGPHQDFLRKQPPFTGYVAKCLAKNETPTLYNSSSAERDYIYIDDLMSLVTLIGSDVNKRNVYNIGTGAGYSVPKLYEFFLEASQKEIEPEFKDPREYWSKYRSLFDSRYEFSLCRVEKEVYKQSVANMSKCEKEFNWRPHINIESGIKKVYDYVENNI